MKKSSPLSEVRMPSFGPKLHSFITFLCHIESRISRAHAFLGTSRLSATQIAGHDETETHPGVARWKYEFRKRLVPRKSCLCFQCKCASYMITTCSHLAVTTARWVYGLKMKITFVARIWCGCILKNYTNYTIKTPLTSVSLAPSFCKWCSSIFIYIISESYYMPSIDRFLVSFVQCRMEIQTCRKNEYFHLGFIDQVVVNCVTLKDNPQEIFHNKFSSIQHCKQNTVFP
jgi:hypothetical protein